MTELAEKRCLPCEAGVRPIGREEAERLISKLHEDWSLNDDATEIRREFKFKGFHKTMGFVNAVAWIANAENHHPDLEVGWGRCLVRYRFAHALFQEHLYNGLGAGERRHDR